MKKLAYYPLWVIVAIWFLLVRAKRTTLIEFNQEYDAAMIALIELIEALEMIEERDRLTTWLIRRLIAWYDQQHESLVNLAQTGTLIIGGLEK